MACHQGIPCRVLHEQFAFGLLAALRHQALDDPCHRAHGGLDSSEDRELRPELRCLLAHGILDLHDRDGDFLPVLVRNFAHGGAGVDDQVRAGDLRRLRIELHAVIDCLRRSAIGTDIRQDGAVGDEFHLDARHLFLQKYDRIVTLRETGLQDRNMRVLHFYLPPVLQAFFFSASFAASSTMEAVSIWHSL